MTATPIPPLGAGNPLLEFSRLPRFDAIRAEHVIPAVRQLLAQLEVELSRLEGELSPTWSGLIEPLEQIDDRLDFTWGTVKHLLSVKNSDALRQAHDQVQGEVVAFGQRLAQSRPIFDGLNALAEGADLSPARRRLVDKLILSAELAGVGLEKAARDRFNAIQTELAELSTQFSNNVLDAIKGYALRLSDPAEVEGLPESLLAQAAQAARGAGEAGATAVDGPWHIRLDYPSYLPFMKYSHRRDLREQLFRARVALAGEGEHDNRPLIPRIIRLRREKAALLGYATYAELSLARKMADSVEAVDTLLEDLRRASYPFAERDLEDLRQAAREAGAPEADDFQRWDVLYWAERLRERRFDYHAEDLRPYFPLERVLSGLFALTERLFDVRIERADGNASLWHQDVRFFEVFDGSGEPLASFYLDPYSRPEEKRGGAWMFPARGRSRSPGSGPDGVRRPVAYVTCNQTPPVEGKPSLATLDEVSTLFHEFGHALQHMLTEVDDLFSAGTSNVEWDAVEVPSTFMENWCYQTQTLRELSQHYQTGEPLPLEEIAKIQAARTFRSGSQMLGQLHYGMTDMALHAEFDPDGDKTAFDVQRAIREKTDLLPEVSGERALCSFNHIFAGAYAAGYYSYKWADVLSADVFAAFEEAGLDNGSALPPVGRRFRETFLALGGSVHPMEVFRRFRGREPTIEALLRLEGLARRRG